MAEEIRMLDGLAPLIKLLDSRNPEVQKYSVMAIGNCGDDGMKTQHDM